MSNGLIANADANMITSSKYPNHAGHGNGCGHNIVIPMDPRLTILSHHIHLGTSKHDGQSSFSLTKRQQIKVSSYSTSSCKPQTHISYIILSLLVTTCHYVLPWFLARSWHASKHSKTVGMRRRNPKLTASCIFQQLLVLVSNVFKPFTFKPFPSICASVPLPHQSSHKRVISKLKIIDSKKIGSTFDTKFQ